MSEEKVFRVPEDIVEIEPEAYAGGAFEEVILPEGLFRIGEAAFLECENLSRIHLPKSLSEIADGAFYGCCSQNEESI